MLKPPIPANEIERLQALHALDVLDTPAEERFDRITRVAQRYFQVPIALVSIVDAQRQWFKSKRGLDACETSRGISFCGHAILADDIFHIPNALEDPRFADNPLVTGGPAIRFYAGAPLHAPNGQRIGTLCIIDDKPRQFTPVELSVLRDLADGVEAELERTHLLAAVDEVARLALVAERTDNAVIITDGEGRVEWVNLGFERITGYTLAEVAGKKPGDVLQGPDTDPETVAFMRSKVCAGAAFSSEVLNYRKDGTPYWLALSIQPIHDAQGRVIRFIAIESDISERKRGEQRVQEQNKLLDAINRAQSQFIAHVAPTDIFQGLLESILAITGSEYGFIGEVMRTEDGRPYIKTHGITNIAWDETTRRFHDENAPTGLEFHKLDNLFGHVVTAGVTVIANDPAHDPRRGGLPNGHPALNSFLGIPFYEGEQVVGMIGVANRAGGYDESLLPQLEPLRTACKNIIESLRLEKRRLQAEAALLSSENRIRAIIDTVVDGIVTIDAHGSVRSFNPAAERIFGYRAEQVVGHNVNMLMPEPYHAAHDGYLHNYLSTGKKMVIGIGREVIGQRQDGSTFPMELAVSEMAVNGERMFTGIVRDITERKQMERMKSEFVSTVSHELRTPLTSIRGALGLVLGKFSDALPDKARQLLDTANRNSERLTLLINDILDLEKIESGRLEFERKATDLVAVARHALVANEGYGQQHDVALRLVATPERAMVQADEHRLLQVFANLISNAVKYSPQGGTVDVALGGQAGRIRVSVRDRGPGIPAEFRSRMFQRFAQADSSDTRQKGGTGLGLSITKAIVERHGGSIGFTSEEGVGTEFHFELPEWREIIEQSSGAADRPTMLICEDNADVAMVLAELLEQEGVSSDRVTTGAAALEMLGRKQYRALLLDLNLPDMDGMTLIQHLRSDAATRNLPVIVVSGRTREDTAAWDGQALSVIDWLQKPVDRERLGQALNQALQSQRRPRILHVEDDTDIIQVTQALLEEDADYTYATSLAAARLALAQSHCDLLLLDLTLPDGSGLELLDAISPDTRVIVFSGQDPGAALRQHVTAALVKGTTSNDRLLATIKQVIHQERN
ncbi:MAG: PAS domain S-box protein [Rhodocyclaceae bacterium]|nr:PAS domain S-box protein [Rhodocyclaceae bacterium]